MFSCKDIEPDLHIFSNMEDCKNIENLKSEDAKVKIYDSPKVDKDLKKLVYQDFFGCEYKSDDFSFELFAYVFENDDIAMDYFENVTGKVNDPNPTFLNSAGMFTYERIVINYNKAYRLTCKNTNKEKVIEFINICFSTEVQIGETKIKVENFNLDDYSHYIEVYAENKNVGEIKTAEIAEEKAEKLWKEHSFELKYYKLPENLDFKVSYDKNKECWLVSGFTAPTKNLDGSIQVMLESTPNAIIQKDGKVLAVWLDIEG